MVLENKKEDINQKHDDGTENPVLGAFAKMKYGRSIQDFDPGQIVRIL